MKNLLIDAREEILRLRRENEILRAKVDTMDLFALVLNTKPAYFGHAMSEDVAWKLDKEIQRIHAETPTTGSPARAEGTGDDPYFWGSCSLCGGTGVTPPAQEHDPAVLAPTDPADSRAPASRETPPDSAG
jgi:hypothetical protein